MVAKIYAVLEGRLSCYIRFGIEMPKSKTVLKLEAILIRINALLLPQGVNPN